MVRFADGPTTDATLRISAAPEQLWPLVTDITLPAESSPELQAAVWLDGADSPALGARFEGRNRRGDASWTTTSTVTALVRPRVFSWTVGDVDDAIASWGFELDEVEPGVTEVRQWVVLGPGRSGVTWAIRQDPDAEEAIIAGRLGQLREAMLRNLADLAARVATGDRPGAGGAVSDGTASG